MLALVVLDFSLRVFSLVAGDPGTACTWPGFGLPTGALSKPFVIGPGPVLLLKLEFSGRAFLVAWLDVEVSCCCCIVEFVVVLLVVVVRGRLWLDAPPPANLPNCSARSLSIL